MLQLVHVAFQPPDPAVGVLGGRIVHRCCPRDEGGPSFPKKCHGPCDLNLRPPRDLTHTSRSLAAAGPDDESNQGCRRVPNHPPTLTSSVLPQDIAARHQPLLPTATHPSTPPLPTTPP